MKDLAFSSKASGHATAFGEIGLDYDRLFLSDQASQLKYFEAQLDIAVEVQLPLFLHSRAASEDFERILGSRLKSLPKRGLVHSFTGTMAEMERLVAMGFDIGINGCSMKTEENLEVVKRVPMERLQLETDGPWVPSQSFLTNTVDTDLTEVRSASFACLCQIQSGRATDASVGEKRKMGAGLYGEREERAGSDCTRRARCRWGKRDTRTGSLRYVSVPTQILTALIHKGTGHGAILSACLGLARGWMKLQHKDCI